MENKAITLSAAAGHLELDTRCEAGLHSYVNHCYAVSSLGNALLAFSSTKMSLISLLMTITLNGEQNLVKHLSIKGQVHFLLSKQRQFNIEACCTLIAHCMN